MGRNQIITVYNRFYDDHSLDDTRKILGRFRFIEEIIEDGWDELWIGENTETGTICIIQGREVCGIGSGTSYAIYSIKSLCLKENPDSH